jgi:putative transposase
LRELAAAHPRYGYRRLWVLLRREGHHLNHKRVERLYRQEGLAVRRKLRKRLVGRERQPLPSPSRPNEHWCMDFTSDQLTNGRRFRTFNLVDIFTRECLAIDVAASFPAERVVRSMERIVYERGTAPQRITVDNGPEFISKHLDAWAHHRHVTLTFIQPGKPMQNGFIESFNGKFRDECLDQHLFTAFDDAMTIIADYRHHYNTARPHSSLNNLTPLEFAAQYARTSGAAVVTTPDPSFDTRKDGREAARGDVSKAGAPSKPTAELGTPPEPLFSPTHPLPVFS